MDSKHIQHVNKNSFSCLKDYKPFLKEMNSKMFIFDTESCRKYIGSNKGAKVYSFGLGSVYTDKMVYGRNLNHFIKLFYVISDYLFKHEPPRIRKNRKGYPNCVYINMPVAVHNLAWDLEFLKYELLKQGYNYKMGEIVERFKPMRYNKIEVIREEKTFHIVQDKGNVYGCQVFLPIRHEVKKGNKIIKVCYVIDLFDTFKIMSTSLSNLVDYTSNKVDKMFYKLSAEYDYDRYRFDYENPTQTELRYLYNDIYLLKIAIEQFYFSNLNKFQLEPIFRTASSIAFELLKKFTFGDDYNKKYMQFFELDKSCNYDTTRKEIEKVNYSGGYTHANHKYIDKLLNVKGGSLDINSSYPSQMKYKPLPYGKPVKFIQGSYEPIENHVAIIELGFDYVKPKKHQYDLPVFKIGSVNNKSLSKIYGDLSGNEYFSTNIDKNDNIIPVYRELYPDSETSPLTTNYQISVTSFEYDFFIKHFDFGVIPRDTFKPVELVFNGPQIGNVLYYKSMTGLVSNFITHFTKMKILYKGRTKEQINEDIKNDKNYYNNILTDTELKKALVNGVEPNPSLVAFAKLVLNSSYGKFGTKTDKKESDLYVDDEGLCKMSTDTDMQTIHYESKEFYRPFASFVTAHGRLQLWNTIIYAIGVDDFLYCDTDSIYFKGNVDEKINNMNKIGETVDKTILGKWDLETHFNSFKVLGQKKYMYFNTDKDKKGNIKGLNLKCCGLPESARKEICKQGFNEFYLGKNVEGKKQRVKVVGGCLLINVNFKIQKIMFAM